MCLSPSDAERREEREELKRRRRHTQQQAKHAAANTHLHPKPLEHAASPSCSRNIKLAGWLEESIAFWAVIGVKPVRCRRQVPPNRAENCAAERASELAALRHRRHRQSRRPYVHMHIFGCACVPAPRCPLSLSLQNRICKLWETGEGEGAEYA